MERNPAYDGPMGIFEGHGEMDPTGINTEVVITSNLVAPRWQGRKGKVVRILPPEMSPYFVDVLCEGIVLTMKRDEFVIKE